MSSALILFRYMEWHHGHTCFGGVDRIAPASQWGVPALDVHDVKRRAIWVALHATVKTYLSSPSFDPQTLFKLGALRLTTVVQPNGQVITVSPRIESLPVWDSWAGIQPQGVGVHDGSKTIVAWI